MRRLRTLSVVSMIGATVLLPFAARAQNPGYGTQTVNEMNKLWGRHPGIRANHAKGVVVEGTFTPTKDAASLSKAALFQGQTIPVTVRFSDATRLACWTLDCELVAHSSWHARRNTKQ